MVLLLVVIALAPRTSASVVRVASMARASGHCVARSVLPTAGLSVALDSVAHHVHAVQVASPPSSHCALVVSVGLGSYLNAVPGHPRSNARWELEVMAMAGQLARLVDVIDCGLKGARVSGWRLVMAGAVVAAAHEPPERRIIF